MTGVSTTFYYFLLSPQTDQTGFFFFFNLLKINDFSAAACDELKALVEGSDTWNTIRAYSRAFSECLFYFFLKG